MSDRVVPLDVVMQVMHVESNATGWNSNTPRCVAIVRVTAEDMGAVPCCIFDTASDLAFSVTNSQGETAWGTGVRRFGRYRVHTISLNDIARSSQCGDYVVFEEGHVHHWLSNGKLRAARFGDSLNRC